MNEQPELRTERLLLRPFRSDDVDDVLGYATDPEWGRYLPVPDPYTRRSAERFVAGAILADPDTRPIWAIVHEGRVSGALNLTVRSPGRAELGYSIARQLWGRGLTTEAAAAVIGYGFESLELVRIFAMADVRNTASWRVMEKLGMQREGMLRRHAVLRGEHVDHVLYAVLADEWPPPS